MKAKIIIVLLLITSLLCASAEKRNERYTIFYKDGTCYMRFADDIFAKTETWRALSRASGCIALVYPKFDSVAEMKAEILSGDLDDSQLYAIWFTAKDKKMVEIYDLDKLQIPLLPTDYTLTRAKWYGISYSVGFKGNSAVVSSGSVSCMGEEKYRSLFEQQLAIATNENHKVMSDTVVSERNARVIHSSTGVAELRDVFYTLSGANGYTLHIMETYVLRYYRNTSTDTSDTVPQSIHMFGTNGENYFHSYFHKPKERPSVEWLSSFGLTPFDASTSS